MLGTVVNEKPNLDKDTYKQFRAVMYNCATKDLYAEASAYSSKTGLNFDSLSKFIMHLQGKVTWYCRILNPTRKAQFQSWMEVIKQKAAALQENKVWVEVEDSSNSSQD